MILSISSNKKEFAGDITLVVFPLLRVIKGNPAVIADTLGNGLVEKSEIVSGFNVVKGFLNIELSDSYFINLLREISLNESMVMNLLLRIQKQ